MSRLVGVLAAVLAVGDVLGCVGMFIAAIWSAPSLASWHYGLTGLVMFVAAIPLFLLAFLANAGGDW